jgi:hypothetical protein
VLVDEIIEDSPPRRKRSKIQNLEPALEPDTIPLVWPGESELEKENELDKIDIPGNNGSLQGRYPWRKKKSTKGRKTPKRAKRRTFSIPRKRRLASL